MYFPDNTGIKIGKSHNFKIILKVNEIWYQENISWYIKTKFINADVAVMSTMYIYCYLIEKFHNPWVLQDAFQILFQFQYTVYPPIIPWQSDRADLSLQQHFENDISSGQLVQEQTGIPAVGCLSTPAAFPTPGKLSSVARGSFLRFAF